MARAAHSGVQIKPLVHVHSIHERLCWYIYKLYWMALQSFAPHKHRTVLVQFSPDQVLVLPFLSPLCRWLGDNYRDLRAWLFDIPDYSHLGGLICCGQEFLCHSYKLYKGGITAVEFMVVRLKIVKWQGVSFEHYAE